MSEPTAFGLSKLFTQLAGRKVSFSQATAVPETKTKQIYGIYNLPPDEIVIIVKADLPLISSFAGVLVGLPDVAVKERIGTNPLDELLRDAIHEVLNIVSASIATEGRAVLTKMVTDPAYLDGVAGSVYRKPGHRSNFNVQIDGYQGGRFSVLSQIGVVRVVRP